MRPSRRPLRGLLLARIPLDSHRRTMATAIALYRNLGFVEIPPYGPDLGGEIGFFEKVLHEWILTTPAHHC